MKDQTASAQCNYNMCKTEKGYLQKSMFTCLEQWSKSACAIDIEASTYKESKHQFVPIVEPWMQYICIHIDCLVFNTAWGACST